MAMAAFAESLTMSQLIAKYRRQGASEAIQHYM